MLRGLGSRDPGQAWDDFFRSFSPLILQVVHVFERDPDHIADCFFYVCDQLSRRRFRRLRRFRPQGPARFETWLRAVVRNLCVDWHRKEFGRQRVFRAIARLPKLEQAVFQCVYGQGLTFAEALLALRPRFPELSEDRLVEASERIRGSLTPRQRWLVESRYCQPARLGTPFPDDVAPEQLEIPDSRPDPESLVAQEEMRAVLARAVARLPEDEQLLIRLRFEQGLTLEQIAKIAHRGDPQGVQRRIKEILERLRKEIS